MYGLNCLKPEMEVDRDRVLCPVLGCGHTVVSQRRGDEMRHDRFHCDKHRIFISPTTWEYDDRKDNILWNLNELEAHFKAKREERIARDNSEDAVTWNVFRYLINCNRLGAFLQEMTGREVGPPVSCFWSYSDADKGPCVHLNQARAEFGETIRRGSEPDLIIWAGNMLFFVEAKLGSGNSTKPSTPGNPKKYEIGGEGWFSRVFAPKSTYRHVAEDEKRYELLRFWLLGTWMANKTPGTDFVLANLVREASKEDIEGEFGKHIVQDAHKRFVRWTWEGIARFIARCCPDAPEKTAVLEYFRQKSLGYRPTGQGTKRIVKAFTV